MRIFEGFLVWNNGFSCGIFWNIRLWDDWSLFAEFHISVSFYRCIPFVTQQNEKMMNIHRAKRKGVFHFTWGSTCTMGLIPSGAGWWGCRSAIGQHFDSIEHCVNPMGVPSLTKAAAGSTAKAPDWSELVNRVATEFGEWIAWQMLELFTMWYIHYSFHLVWRPNSKWWEVQLYRLVTLLLDFSL